MSTPFSGYDDVDDLTVLGSAINTHKTALNDANVKSAARLKLALSGAIVGLVNTTPGASDEIKVTTRTQIQNTLAEVLETRGLEGLAQVLHMAPAAKPTSTPVASLGAGTGVATPDPADPETARKVAIADTLIAACGGNVDNAERNAKAISQYLPNAQFMRYVITTFSLVNDPKNGVYVMNDPATNEVVLSTTYKAEQDRDAYRTAFEQLLTGMFGAGNLPSGDRSKQLSAARAKLASMSTAPSGDIAQLTELRDKVAAGLRVQQGTMSVDKWHEEVVKASEWYYNARDYLATLATDTAGAFKLDPTKVGKMNATQIAEALIEEARKQGGDTDAIRDYLKKVGLKSTALQGKSAEQLFFGFVDVVRTAVDTHYTKLSSARDGLAGTKVVDGYSLKGKFPEA